MSVSATDLAALVNSGASDSAVIARCLAFGQSVVETYTQRVPETVVIPAEILDEAVLTAAADQFQRRKAPNGVLNQVFDNGDGIVPVRISRDPYDSIRHLLSPWVPARKGLRTISVTSGPDE